MNYEIAKAMGIDVTYGWMITDVTSGGPADKAGLQGGTSQIQVASSQVIVGGDIIIAFDGARIRNMDENTLPGQTINVTLIRNGQTMTVSLKLEARPVSA
jgi:S1-C subfamily serine protease